MHSEICSDILSEIFWHSVWHIHFQLCAWCQTLSLTSCLTKYLVSPDNRARSLICYLALSLTFLSHLVSSSAKSSAQRSRLKACGRQVVEQNGEEAQSWKKLNFQETKFIKNKNILGWMIESVHILQLYGTCVHACMRVYICESYTHVCIHVRTCVGMHEWIYCLCLLTYLRTYVPACGMYAGVCVCRRVHPCPLLPLHRPLHFQSLGRSSHRSIPWSERH